MEHVVGATSRAHEVPDLAVRYAEADGEREALLWRPSIFRAPEIHGEANVRAALDTPGGIVLAFAHLSSYTSMFAAFKAALGPVYVVGAARYFQATDRGAPALRLRRTRDVIESCGHPFVPAPGSFEVLRAALRAERTVAIAFDVHGKTRVRLVGRDVCVAGGGSRLAVDTGSTVLPALFRNEGPTVHVSFERPLQPAAGEEPAALEQRLVTEVFEPAILERPWALHEPELRWVAH
jgi:lauroyl/myristoyl acyltransferase